MESSWQSVFSAFPVAFGHGFAGTRSQTRSFEVEFSFPGAPSICSTQQSRNSPKPALLLGLITTDGVFVATLCQGWRGREAGFGGEGNGVWERVWAGGRPGRPLALTLPPHLSLLPPGTTLALKQLPKASTSLRGFLYEFCVGLSLGTHSAIVTAYGIGIESANSYSFLTEPVLYGDLITFIQPKVGRWRPSRPPKAPHWASLEFTGTTDPTLYSSEIYLPPWTHPRPRWGSLGLEGIILDLPRAHSASQGHTGPHRVALDLIGSHWASQCLPGSHWASQGHAGPPHGKSVGGPSLSRARWD